MYLHANTASLMHAKNKSKTIAFPSAPRSVRVVWFLSFSPGRRWLMSTSSPSSCTYALASPSSTM